MEKISETKKCLPSKIRAFLKTSTSSKEAVQGVATIIKEENSEIEETVETVPEQSPVNEGAKQQDQVEVLEEENEIEKPLETVPEQAPENEGVKRQDQVDHTYFAHITCKVCLSTYSARTTFIAHYVAVHLMDQQVNKKTYYIYYLL